MAWTGATPRKSTPAGGADRKRRKRRDHIVDVDQPDRGGRVVDCDRQAAGDVVAEGGHDRVVVGPAPFAEHVGQPEDGHRRAGLLRVRLQRAPPPPACCAPYGLSRPAWVDDAKATGTARSASPQRVAQARGEAGVAGGEVRRVLRPVDAGQVDHRVGGGDGRGELGVGGRAGDAAAPRGPAARTARTRRFLPMKPSAPVTRIFMRQSSGRAGSAARPGRCMKSSLQQQRLHRRHVEPLGVVRVVVLAAGDARLALLDELAVVEVAQVGRHAEVAAQVLARAPSPRGSAASRRASRRGACR